MANDYADEVAGAIIRQLEEGTAPWTRPWQPGARFMPYNPTSGNDYHGMNALWLLSVAQTKGYDDARWMTYRQAQAQGAQVRKGERAAVIQYWKWEGLQELRDEDGQPILDDNDEPKRRVVRYERPRVWSAAVFNARQIDGLPPPPDRPAAEAWERHERCEQILVNSKAIIHHQPRDRAYYHLASDEIVLPERGQFPAADGYYATALHELGHWSGHPSRLARDLGHPYGSQGYAREELRAEIASLMLGEQLQIGHDPSQHAAYIGSWIEALEKDPREIFRAAADAEKIARLVRSYERVKEQELEEREFADSGPQWDPQELPDGSRGHPPELLPAEDGQPASRAEQAAIVVREDHPAMSSSSERTYLAVPYAEKDEAKALGAKWDARQKAWYVPAGTELDGFRAWLPAMGAPVVIETGSDPREEFAAALRDCGLLVDSPVEMDGKLHRVRAEGDKGTARSGTYFGHLDGWPAGFIQNFRTGVKINWKASGQAPALSAEQRAQLAAEAAQRQHDRALEREETWGRTAQEVAAMLEAAAPCETHPYLDTKGVRSHGLRQDQDGRLLVPVQDKARTVWSVQAIGADGFKQFQENSRVEGGHFVIGDLDAPGPLLIAEGYATAATIHELTGQPAIVAFNAGNLPRVAETYRSRFPERPILIAGDDDRHHAGETMPDGRPKPNVGREKAEEAAAAIGGQAIFPVFPDGDKGTDWNDLAHSQGRERARAQLHAVLRSAERKGIVQERVYVRERATEISQPCQKVPSQKQRGVDR
jgi:Antirestriction protein